MSFKVPHRFRIRTGLRGSRDADGNNGAFRIKLNSGVAFTIASDGLGWEHVSVSFVDHTPRWDDMCEVKDMFWGIEDCVVQYHPPKSVYGNAHEYCLHLWRPIGLELMMPPLELVALER